MTNAVPSRHRYYSTQALRDEAVTLVKDAMDQQGLSRTRAATIVAANLGFSRSAVVGWCEEAGVLAAPESQIDRVRATEIALMQQINRRLASRLSAGED